MAARLATDADAPALAELRWRWRAESSPPTEPVEQFRERVAQWMTAHRSSHQAFVATAADEVIGMAWLATSDRLPDPGTPGKTYGEIQSVYVREELRSGGHGSELIRFVIDYAEAHGIGWLSVRPSRLSVAFYQRLGFEGTGDRLLHRP